MEGWQRVDGKQCSCLCLLQSEETWLLRLLPFSFFFFLPRETKLQRQADIIRQSQDPTFAMSIEVLIALGSYWQTL